MSTRAARALQNVAASPRAAAETQQAPTPPSPATPDPNATPPLVHTTSIFSLAPALYNNGIIDYSTAAGGKLYKQAIKKL